MRKKIILYTTILAILILVAVIFLMNYTKKKETVNDNVIGQNNEKNESKDTNMTEVKRLVMVDNILYYDTKEESKIIGRCGVMDGSITSNISSNEIPSINNQANFTGNYGYQRIDNTTIELNINNKWIVFKAMN